MLELTFTRKKLTKNTVQFSEDERPGKPLVVGSLYVQKWAAGDRETVTVQLLELGEE